MEPAGHNTELIITTVLVKLKPTYGTAQMQLDTRGLVTHTISVKNPRAK